MEPRQSCPCAGATAGKQCGSIAGNDQMTPSGGSAGPVGPVGPNQAFRHPSPHRLQSRKVAGGEGGTVAKHLNPGHKTGAVEQKPARPVGVAPGLTSRGDESTPQTQVGLANAGDVGAARLPVFQRAIERSSDDRSPRKAPFPTGVSETVCSGAPRDPDCVQQAQSFVPERVGIHTWAYCSPTAYPSEADRRCARYRSPLGSPVSSSPSRRFRRW